VRELAQQRRGHNAHPQQRSCSQDGGHWRTYWTSVDSGHRRNYATVYDFRRRWTIVDEHPAQLEMWRPHNRIATSAAPPLVPDELGYAIRQSAICKVLARHRMYGMEFIRMRRNEASNVFSSACCRLQVFHWMTCR
jgi:hypothetical protein